MLKIIKNKGAKLLIKFIALLIALSFVLVGFRSFMNSREQDIVKFSHMDSISLKQFQQEKEQEIRNVNREYGIALTEQQLNEINIDHIVLSRLINQAMIDYLIKLYKLDVSDNLVFSFIKEVVDFKDKNGNFQIENFNKYFGNSEYKKSLYIENEKKKIVREMIQEIFCKTFDTATFIKSNIADYLTETVKVKIIEADLSVNKSQGIINVPDDKFLQKYYQENMQNFISPEKREMSYIKINDDFIKSKINITDNELKDHYDNNKEYKLIGTFTKAKKVIKNNLESDKLQEMKEELLSMLESDISSQKTLEEIAEKYNFKVHNIDVTKDNLSNQFGVANVQDVIFELEQDELSFPIEDENNQKIFILRVNKIYNEKVKEFVEARQEVISNYFKSSIRDNNLKLFTKLHSNYIKQKRDISKNKNLSIKSHNKSLNRLDIEKTNLPLDLVNMIFSTEKNHTTQLVVSGDKAYFAYVNAKQLNKKHANRIEKDLSKTINYNIQNMLFEDLLFYLSTKNNIKISQ